MRPFLKWSRERLLAIRDCITAFPWPCNQLLKEVIDLLDEIDYCFEGLSINQSIDQSKSRKRRRKQRIQRL